MEKLLKNKTLMVSCGFWLVVLAIGWLVKQADSLDHAGFEGELRTTIQNALDGGDEFAMADVTDFRWDMFIVGDSDKDQDNMDLPPLVPWPQEDGRLDDGVCLLTFFKEWKMVHHCLYPKRNGDFSALHGVMGMTPETAVFEVMRDDEKHCVVRVKENEKLKRVRFE